MGASPSSDIKVPLPSIGESALTWALRSIATRRASEPRPGPPRQGSAVPLAGGSASLPSLKPRGDASGAFKADGAACRGGGESEEPRPVADRAADAIVRRSAPPPNSLLRAPLLWQCARPISPISSPAATTASSSSSQPLATTSPSSDALSTPTKPQRRSHDHLGSRTFACPPPSWLDLVPTPRWYTGAVSFASALLGSRNMSSMSMSLRSLPRLPAAPAPTNKEAAEAAGDVSPEMPWALSSA